MPGRDTGLKQTCFKLVPLFSGAETNREVRAVAGCESGTVVQRNQPLM